MPKFIKGLELAEKFYWEVVRHIIKSETPKLKHTACLIGRGSEVLGHDDQVSTDHDWGPRLLLFVENGTNTKAVKESIERKLPRTFKGHPVSFTQTTHKWGVRLPEQKKDGPINSKIDVYTIEEFFKEYLYFDIKREPTCRDWLTVPQQKLLSITRGKIFHDDLKLERILRELNYYPEEIWHYLLVGQWKRIGELGALHARTSETKDEFGSRLIAGKMVQQLAELWFIYNKKYWPFEKWFGTEFAKLPSANQLRTKFSAILSAENVTLRSKKLDETYSIIAKLHNSLNLPKIPPKTTPFFARPYHIIQGKKIAAQLSTILTPELKNLKIRHGNIDQLINQVDLVDNTTIFKDVY